MGSEGALPGLRYHSVFADAESGGWRAEGAGGRALLTAAQLARRVREVVQGHEDTGRSRGGGYGRPIGEKVGDEMAHALSPARETRERAKQGESFLVKHSLGRFRSEGYGRR